MAKSRQLLALTCVPYFEKSTGRALDRARKVEVGMWSLSVSQLEQHAAAVDDG